ncbi:hypothetical protein AJ78_05592 [Emergomyces pasteurianus Ep9510]|uniref:Uncharacterized protein n=1 Tax=Emergomyces pasteurianus Ep9510 TaxID=1447872 RepID=A0A1J9QFQ9_9EURO|nr:hypothetical protein AJ78_05592 [Emergomyces pasteurianus Ep9510]
MDLYFSLAEKQLATSIVLVWAAYHFGFTVRKLLQGYFNRAAARRRQLRRSSRASQGSQRAETDNATTSQT